MKRILFFCLLTTIVQTSFGNNINFKDPEVKRICLENWDTDNDEELSLEEAAAVTDIGEVFKENTTITTFDELQYFTGLTTIAERAFNMCKNLASVTLPEDITSIGLGAFVGCSLTSLRIPANVEEIGLYAFEGNASLTTIQVDAANTHYDSRNQCNAIIETATNTLVQGCKATVIPSGITKIGNFAFELMNVTHMDLPQSLEEIAWCGFYGCSGLDEVIFPDGLKSIARYAYNGCICLKNIVIPASVGYLGGASFAGCYNIETLTVAPGNETYYSPDGSNAIVSKDGSTLIAGCKNTIIPENVVTIAYECFRDQSHLTAISIPALVSTIEAYAFAGCTSLNEIDIPSSVESIGEYAFSGCQIESVTARNAVPIAITANVFSNYANAILYVPKGSKEAYENANYWKDFMKIEEIEDLIPGDINGNKITDYEDVDCLINKILGLADETYAYDVNNDNKIDIADVTCLIDIIMRNLNNTFHFSENTVDLFVNSSTNVVIEMGNGEYELQNDYTDILDAELLIADKDENPNAKDELIIYGLANGIAQLKVRDIKSNTTATIAVNVKTLTTDDIEKQNNYVTSVDNYISLQEESPIADFQEDMLSWLNNQDWVKQTKLSPDSSQIEITFENGTNFMVVFQDMSLFKKPKETQNARFLAKSEAEEDIYYDVTSQEGEEIIESPYVLFAQCTQMFTDPEEFNWFTDDDWWSSNAPQEKEEVEKNINDSPLALKDFYHYFNKDIKFLNNDWKDYGMILISQTHGLSDARGGFIVEDKYDPDNVSNQGLLVYVENGHIIPHYNGEKQKHICFIKPYVLLQKLKDSKAVYLGNYCWSYRLSEYLTIGKAPCTIYGNTSEAGYGYLLKVINKFTKEMFSGMTITDSYNHVEDEHFVDIYQLINKSKINKQSKRRYFSAKTLLTTPSSNVYWTVLGGYIYGINNLKKDEITFKIWYSEQPFEKPNNNMNFYTLTIDDRTSYQYGVSFYDRWDISTDGKVLRVLKHFPLNTRTGQNKLYSCIGFEHNGKIYHGDVRVLTY